MLNFRTFARTAPSLALPMAQHVLTQTLSPQEIDLQRRFGRAGIADAIVRPDMHPDLAALLGVTAGDTPTLREFARLLAGRRADGEPLPGKQIQSQTSSLAVEAGLTPGRFATVSEAAAIMAGMRADNGAPLPVGRLASINQRFALLYGINPDAPSETLLELVESAKGADGQDLKLYRYDRALEACRLPLAHLHLVFSAEKAASVAWAAAATASERALIAACHKRAVERTMQYVEGILGYVRRGKAGRAGREDGHIGYVSMMHYTGRPTWARVDGPGSPRAKVPGDPLLHSHVCVFNVVLAGHHVGSLNLQELDGRVHQIGAYYTACMATELRAIGVDLVVDDKGGLRVARVPEGVREYFSKRTQLGVKNARQFAGLTDDEWENLWPRERIARAKRGVQGDPAGFKADDEAALGYWAQEMQRLGWTPEPLIDLDAAKGIDDPEERLQLAETVAARLLDAQVTAGAKIDLTVVRLAATRGLIASGIANAADIGLVAERLGRRFANAEVRAAAAAVVTHEMPVVHRLRDIPDDQERMRSFIEKGRVTGAAQLVDGGEQAVIAATADLYVALAAGRTIDRLPTIGVDTREKAELITAEIRSRRRAKGDLGPDAFEVDSVDEAGVPAQIKIAVGDPVRLTGRSDAELANRGRGVASVRAPVLIVDAIERDRWLVLKTPRGRAGRVWWSDLESPDEPRHYRLALAYVAPASALRNHYGDRIETYPGGTDVAPRSADLEEARSIFLLVDADAERRAIKTKGRSDGTAAAITAEEIWTSVATNLTRSRSRKAALLLIRRAHRMAVAAAVTLLRTCARFEMRIRGQAAPLATNERSALRRAADGLRASYSPARPQDPTRSPARMVDAMPGATDIKAPNALITAQAQAAARECQVGREATLRSSVAQGPAEIAKELPPVESVAAGNTGHSDIHNAFQADDGTPPKKRRSRRRPSSRRSRKTSGPEL